MSRSLNFTTGGCTFYFFYPRADLLDRFEDLEDLLRLVLIECYEVDLFVYSDGDLEAKLSVEVTLNQPKFMLCFGSFSSSI